MAESLKKKYQTHATGAGTKKAPQRLNLGLQGGGALGAYSWGALTALLRSRAINENHVQISKITGTSAGATQGAILTHALNGATPTQATEDLERYWSAIKAAQNITPENATTFLMHHFYRSATSFMAPGLASITGHFEAVAGDTILQHHREILTKIITDPEKLHDGPTQLFVNAVKKKSDEGGLTPCNIHEIIFTDKALDINAVLASTALQKIGSVSVDGTDHWDGAYASNPALSPLKEDLDAHTLVIAVDNPERGVHKSGHDEDLTYGEIHEHAETHAMDIITLTHDEDWDDHHRMKVSGEFLSELYNRGHRDGLAWVADFEHNRLRLPPVIQQERERKIACHLSSSNQTLRAGAAVGAAA